MKGYKFVSVEFTEDPNVAGRTYWYLCEFASADIGSRVVAPIGRHNNKQVGTVRRVLFAEGAFAPYPVEEIKRVESVIEEKI